MRNAANFDFYEADFRPVFRRHFCLFPLPYLRPSAIGVKQSLTPYTSSRAKEALKPYVNADRANEEPVFRVLFGAVVAMAESSAVAQKADEGITVLLGREVGGSAHGGSVAEPHVL